MGKAPKAEATTEMNGHTNARRLTTLLVFAAIVIGCGDDGSSAPATTTIAAVVATTTTTSDQGTDLAATDLADAIAATGDTYAFTSIVSADGVEITSVDGVQYQGTGSYVVHTGGATVEYIVAPEGRWFRQPLGEWVPLREPAPVRAPLAVFSTPASVTRTSDQGDITVFEATFDGVSLGFAAGDVTVTLQVRDGLLAQIEYTVALGDSQGLATVSTMIDTATEIQPIPIPGG